MLSVQPGLHGSHNHCVGRKISNFILFFPVQGTGGSPTGPDPENRVGNQEIGSLGRPVSSVLQVPGDLGHCSVRTRPPLGEFPAAFFLRNILKLHQQR